VKPNSKLYLECAERDNNISTTTENGDNTVLLWTAARNIKKKKKQYKLSNNAQSIIQMRQYTRMR